MALHELPPLREVIAKYGLSASKALGQNFLLDLNLTAKIARSAGNLEGRHVLEIGPGPGGLTRALLETPAIDVTAVERDHRCLEALQELPQDRLRLVDGDALKLDLASLLPAPRVAVANLPYNIATPLLISLLKNISTWESLTLMFQREVAERIVAAPRTPAYGRLAVISQWLTEPTIELLLPPAAFTPSPKVHSAVVHFVPRQDALRTIPFETMERLTAAAFGQRRKMLRQSLKSIVPKPEPWLESLNIEPTARAEELCVADFCRMASSL